MQLYNTILQEYKQHTKDMDSLGAEYADIPAHLGNADPLATLFFV